MIATCPHCNEKIDVDYVPKAVYTCSCGKDLTLCPACESAVTTTAAKCKHCGKQLKEEELSPVFKQHTTHKKQPESSFSIIRVLLLVAMIVIGLPIALLFAGGIGFIIWIVGFVLICIAKV